MSSLDSHDRIRSRGDYKEFLAADLAAHGLTGWRPWYVLTKPTLHFQRVLRRVEYLSMSRWPHDRVLYILHRVRLARASVRLGVSIPPGVFGRGLSIAHYGSIVVNDRARVGTFCRIHSGTNIGVRGAFAPVIGDRVYIGPGAVIYGGVRVGDDVAVGANSVVGHDVASGVTVAGAPARVVSERGSDGVMPRWMQRDARVPRADAKRGP